VLSGNTVYCNIVFANKLKVQKSYNISLSSKLNVKTSLRRLIPDSSQTHQHKTDRLASDSCQTQIPPDIAIGATIALFAFLATRVATI
jgi:hypothetical protein